MILNKKTLLSYHVHFRQRLDYDVSIEELHIFPAHLRQRLNCDVAFRAAYFSRAFKTKTRL